MIHTKMAEQFWHIDPKQQFWKVFLKTLVYISLQLIGELQSNLWGSQDHKVPGCSYTCLMSLALSLASRQNLWPLRRYILHDLKPVITTWSTRTIVCLSNIQLQTLKCGCLLMCQNSHHPHQTSRQAGEWHPGMGWAVQELSMSYKS